MGDCAGAKPAVNLILTRLRAATTILTRRRGAPLSLPPARVPHLRRAAPSAGPAVPLGCGCAAYREIP